MPGVLYPTGDAVSRLMLQRGDAVAQAQAQRGQLWGNAIANIGGAAANTVSDLVKYQQDAPLRQMRVQEVRKATRENDDEAAISAAMTSANGDPDAAITALGQQSGKGGALMTLRTRVSDWRQKQASTLKEQVDAANTSFTRAQQLLSTVPVLKDKDGAPITSGPDFDRATAAYTSVVPKVRELVGEQLGKMLPDAYDPTFVEQAQGWGETQGQKLEALRIAAEAANNAVTKAKSVREADDYWTKSLSAASGTWASDEDKQHFLGIAKNLGASADTLQKFSDPWSPDAVQKWQALGLTPEEATKQNAAPTAGSREQRVRDKATELYPGRPWETLSATQRNNANAAIDQADNNDVAMDLTPEALKLTAHQYAMTGQLPPMGMGKQGAAVRTKIINEAAKIYDGLDLPSQIAAYKANQGSLVKLQGQADALQAFESTAGKNLQMFVDQAKKVVDTGSPWINKPLQSINKNVLGDADQPAYEAARQVALTEIAKITSNPNLTGQLSDSARAEVTSFSPANASLKQILNVAQVLTQDMANRRTSMHDQIADVQKRIATPPAGVAPPTPAAGPPVTGGQISVTAPNGKTYTFKSQADADAFKAKAGIK